MQLLALDSFEDILAELVSLFGLLHIIVGILNVNAMDTKLVFFTAYMKDCY